MRDPRPLFAISLLALPAICLQQCGPGIVPACSDDFDCSAEPNLFCDLTAHRCIARTCTPDCSDRECGLDPQNCGTSCGACKLPDQHCDPTTGRCQTCSPDCGMRLCGPVPNGCGQSCGSCEAPESCNIANGQCEGCTPDCGARVCGQVPNGCGESCGNCTDSESCDIALGRCDSKTGTLLFDGTFQPNDSLTKWTGWRCLPKSDSLTIVPAPDGRPGYAARFKIAAGYDCGGNQHDQLSYDATNIPNPYREVWYGWSSMLDPTWKPSGSWNSGPSWGATSKFYDSSGGHGNTGLNFQMGATDNHMVLIINGGAYGAGSTPPFAVVHALGVWYDWLFHIRYARDNSGFLEVFLRKGGESGYSKIWSRYDFQTEYPWATPETNYFMPRTGPYRAFSDVTQILYIQDPKIGTTMADVIYR